jgi:phosphatidylinositol glycan class T
MLIARLRGQKADPSNSESSPVSPAGLKLLLKVAFVAVVAVAFHYLSNS